MQMIVLGMHRSGTSMVARLLNMMGAYFSLESNTMRPTVANPKGYWEREDIRCLNDRVMSSLGMSWDNISDFETSLLTEEVQQAIEEDIQKIIFGLDAHRPWMIKDPRLCLLLPLWKPFFEVPVCIYVYRSPIQTAQSLFKRENFPLMLGLALWEKYTLYGLFNSLQFPRILVSHDELIHHPVEATKKLYQDLLDCEVRGIHLPSDKEIRAFIEPKFFHQRGDIHLQNAYINPQQMALVEAFETGTIFQFLPLPSLSLGATEILSEYKDKLCSTQESLMLQEEIGKRDQVIQHQEAELAQKGQEIIWFSQEIEQHHAEVLRQREDIIQRDQKIVDLNQEMNELKNMLGLIKQTFETESTRYKLQISNYQHRLLEFENQTISLKQEMNDLINQQRGIHEQFTETHHQLIQTQNLLASTEQSLEDKNHRVAALTTQLHQRNQWLQRLFHWTEALYQDIQAVFDSLTWRSGNILTQGILTLSFRKAGLTAKDHIEDMMTQIKVLKTEFSSSGEERIVPRSSKTVQSGMPSSLNLPTLPKRQSIIIQTEHDPRDYPRWILQYDTLIKKNIDKMKQHIAQWEYHPVISIVMPTYNTDERWLRAAIESVKAQIYPHWELCIADDASTQSQVRRILDEYAQSDSRIKVVFRTENGHISVASNSALELVTGEFVTFLDHDDLLSPHALFWVVQDIIHYPEAMLWYSDEDKINEKGERHDPYFKCDWNPDLFLSHNLITHLAVYRTSLVNKIQGFRAGFEGAQDYDLALRAIDQISFLQIRHIPRILYHWRTIQGSTAVAPEEKPYAIIAAQKAINEYLGRRNVAARAMESPDIRGTIRVKYELPVHCPLVSLIIPTRNRLDLLRRCVESILHKTDYPHFEILIVDNESDDQETLDYMQQLEQNNQARIIDYPYPFHYADMNNRAVSHAHGEVIGLLNNDLEVINRDWLSEMVSHTLRPEVGIVGARLWYPDHTLQHGGVILGIGGVAGHSHKGLPRGDAGYFGRAGLIQNFSAVTGACMLMRRTTFLKVGGLDAENLSTAFNDVDLCLKMNQYNLRIVWTPYAELYHHESASRGYEDTPEKMARFEKERTYMKGRWPQFIMADPAYSPNLTLETQDFAYAWPPRVAGI